MNQPPVRLDPLDSPFPVPWNWVLNTQAESPESSLHTYRTSALLSPDGDYAAYSRLQMEVGADISRSRVSSALFVEHLQTRELRTVSPTSPLANNPFAETGEPNLSGSIAIAIPIAWSEASDRLLCREFESRFAASHASDYAVVWEQFSGNVYTLSPRYLDYTNAVLLGWSSQHPDRALFRCCNLGDPDWQYCTVDLQGQTYLADADQPLAFGQVRTHLWAGPQVGSRTR
ncbi:MAG: hypothetical protein Fur0046_08380 [Cyanobacteria bacterium J069]